MTSTAEPFERVDIDQAKELIDSGSVALIDVREQEEWDEGYIEGATRISVNDIINMSAVDDLPKDQPIVFLLRRRRSLCPCLGTCRIRRRPRPALQHGRWLRRLEKGRPPHRAGLNLRRPVTTDPYEAQRPIIDALSSPCNLSSPRRR